MHVHSNLPATVADIGTSFSKIGPTNSLTPSVLTSTKTKENNFVSPLSYSKISNVEMFTQHLIAQLNNTDDLILPLNNEPLKVKERILQVLYETKSIKNLLFFESTLANIFSYGKTTGININISESVSVAGIHNGLIFNKIDEPKGGNDITKSYLENNYDVIFEQEKNISDQNVLNYRMFERARFMKEENNDVDVLLSNIKDMFKQVIDSAEEENKNLLLSNVFLSGGCCSLDVQNKINEQLCTIYPQSKLKVTYEKNYHTFVGCSVLGSLGSVRGFFIGEKDWDEYGVGILDRKNMNWLYQ